MFKERVKLIFFLVLLTIALVFFYKNEEKKEDIQIIKLNKQFKHIDARLERLKSLLRHDYNAYGRELGISGLSACRQYNKESWRICDYLYREVSQ